jgi:hypothetical protein
VGNDEVFDAIVNFAVHHAFVKQILLAAVGPETNDAPSPALRHARNLQHFINAGVVDVYSLCGQWRISGCLWGPGLVLILILRPRAEAHQEGR